MECNGCRWYRVEFEEITRYQDDAEGYGRVPVEEGVEPMKTLVDEIRDIAGEARTRGMYPAVTYAAKDLLGRSCLSEEDEAELFAKIADRIEREYMELPILEGEPLKVGDKVDGYSQEGAEVVAIMNEKMVVVRSTVKGGHGYHDKAYPLLLWDVSELKRHEHTDTMERIEENVARWWLSR